jgi:hypothetical protein
VARTNARRHSFRPRRAALLTVILVTAVTSALSATCDNGCALVSDRWFCQGEGGGGGGASTPTAVPTATPTAVPVAKEYWQWLGGMYSYNPGCATGQQIDPVTTVLRHGNSAADVHDSLVSTGLDVEAGAEQSFQDNGRCVIGEISVADDGLTKLCGFPAFVCASDRWHARANVVSSADPAGGYWASSTPHRDSSDGSPIDQCGHVIHQSIEIDGFSGSGFDVGKDWLWWQLVAEQGRFFEGAQYWDNIASMYQCNGELTGSNGWVNVIWLNR